MARYFVTRLVVERVDTDDRTDGRKNKTTIANIVVSASDLEALKAKASQHLALVEDGGDIENRTTRG